MVETGKHTLTISEDFFPLTILMRHSIVQHGIWESERWQAEGVVVGEHHQCRDVQRELVRVGDNFKQYLWSGLQLKLYSDAAEGYYFNIVSDSPKLFVICSTDETTNEIIPAMVSVSYDEITAHLEVDDPVFQLPMPAEVYRWVEDFVMQHYLPEKKKKRKLTNWKAGETS